MLRIVWRVKFIAIGITVWSQGIYAWAVNPNPLQNAYWRFEEGSAFQQVTPRNADVVLDSINNNDMRAAMDENFDAAPTYTPTVPPKPLKSGMSNTLALEFAPNQDIFANAQDFNNGYILPGDGFTVEAAIYSYDPNRYGGVVAKEGAPTGSGLPTFAIKTTGPGDATPSHLRVQQYDAAQNLVQVTSLAPLNAQQWYYVAAVNDGSQLSLWLDSGFGYELQGSAAVNGALYQGPPSLSDYNNDLKVDAADYVLLRKDHDGDQGVYDQWRAEFGKNTYDWDNTWTIGRAQFDGAPNDWFDGIIDEVRLTNTALAPSDFLFAPAAEGALGDGSVPEPASFVSAALAMAAATIVRGSRRRRFSSRRMDR